MNSTPILNREQPLPPVKKKRWVPLLIGGVLGGLLVFLDTREILPPGNAMLIGFLPAFYVGVLLHELGHVAAGLSAGFELRLLSVGAFRLTREAHRWKLRFIASHILLAGGLTGMSPKSADRLIDRYMRLVLGGPAASIILLVISVILTLIFPDSSTVRVLLIVNLLLAIAPSLPYTVRSQPSDAKLILLLNRKGPAAERLASILYLLELDARQTDPRDWPRELVEKISAPIQDKSYLGSAASIWYADALTTGDVERIAEALERALSESHHFGPDLQRAFYVSASCFQGIYRHHAPLAELWLESARKVKYTTSQKDWDSKALAAIALARGEHARAHELLTRYLTVLDRCPPSGLIAAERVRTVAVMETTNSSAGSPAVPDIASDNRLTDAVV